MTSNPFAQHDSEADDTRLRQLRRAQATAVKRITMLEGRSATLAAKLSSSYATLHRIAMQLGEVTHPKAIDRGTEIASRSITADLAATLRVSDRTISARLNQGAVFEEYPRVMGALEQAKIGVGHARVITQIGLTVDNPGRRDVYERTVLEYAQTHSVNRTRAFAKRVAEQLCDTELPERHDAAMRKRRVYVRESDDGMAELCILTSAPMAYAMRDRIARMAQRCWQSTRDAAEDDRTRGNLTADIFTDLALTATPASHGDASIYEQVTAEIQLVVPALSLLPSEVAKALRSLPELQLVAGVHSSAEMPGYGPISDEIARLFTLHEPGWDRVMVHPELGEVLAVDRYRPSAQQKRFIVARDQHCRFIGCVSPMASSEIDHTLEAENGGATSTDNLSGLCVRHHALKHHHILETYRWKVEQDDRGVLTWISPNGAEYVDEPVSRVMFLPVASMLGDRANPDDEPAPF